MVWPPVPHPSPPVEVDSVRLRIPVALLAASALAAVVAWFMAWVRTRGFTVFAVYRLLLGAAVLWWAR